MISMNVSMKDFLNRVDLKDEENCLFSLQKEGLNEFKKILNQTFSEHPNGLVLTQGGELNMDQLLKMYTDLSGIEFTLNEVYLPNVIGETSLFIQFEIGKMILNAWSVSLCEQFPDSDFKFILGIDFGEFPGVKIRFHKRRENEIVLDEDVENYKNEGIYVFDVN